MVSLKEKVLNRIEQNRNALFKDLEEIVRVPSVVGVEGKAQEWLYEKMRSMGLTVGTFEADKDHRVSHPGYINVDWPYQGRPNVIAVLKGRPSAKSIILAGHIDVVSPEPVTAWEHNPWGAEISGGKMYGRGTADMKGGLIANLYAVKALTESGAVPDGTVMVFSTIEEEAGGGGGTLACLRKGYRANAMLNTKPEEKYKKRKLTPINKLLPERHEWRPTLNAIWRGTGIGCLIGLLSGANAVTASVMSYTVEKRVAKDPSRFGKGAIEGVAGPETANNACAGAAVIPLFTLGIPSSPTIAVLFGAFLLHGLTPGPLLYKENPGFVWGVIASFYIGNVILVIMNLPLARIWGKVALVPFSILFPLVLIFCMVGAYSVNNNLWDVGVLLVFGFIGYFMKKMGFPMAAIVIPFVLGAKMEAAFVQSLFISGGSMMIFFTRPICIGLLCVVAILLAGSIYGAFKNKRGMLASDTEA